NFWFMSRSNALKVRHLTKETLDCTSVSFEVSVEDAEAFAFLPGQYLTLRTEIEGEDVRRSYSLCTAPSEGDLRVAVKHIPGGLFSGFVHEDLKVGDTLDVMPPMGRFTPKLDATQRRNYVGIAAGSGITPIMSIMKTALETEPESTFTLLYGNRFASSVIFKEQIEGLKNQYLERLRVFHFMSREVPDIPLFSGRLSGEKIDQCLLHLIDGASIDGWYICGPEAMTTEIRDTLEQQGVAKDRVHFELFTAAKSNGKRRKVQAAATGPERISEVHIKDGGNSFAFNMPLGSQPVLDAALERGADLPFACKGGVCCTCKAKLIEGKVEMEVNYALEPEEVEAGYILSCQAIPLSEKIVVDFDEAL
ncbi:MAG: 1,2-phenylacetyl-CoA epoxidase subunit PaaE, partial [Bacteroidota bacterium]